MPIGSREAYVYRSDVRQSSISCEHPPQKGKVLCAREWRTDGGGVTPEGMPDLGHAQRDGARRMQVIAKR